MRLAAAVLDVVLLACNSGTAVGTSTPVASASARPTLTPLALPADVVAVKSSGRIIAIEGSIYIARVDRGNSGAQRAIDDAVIALRADTATSVQLVTTRSDTGVTVMDLRGIAIGDPITFMFELSSLRA